MGSNNVGPVLPFKTYGHAMINVNNILTMMIGGRSTLKESFHSWTTDQTFYYNHDYKTWSDGPKLVQPRQSHAVGIVTDEGKLEFYLVQ